MSKLCHLLHIEDDPNDVQLLQATLDGTDLRYVVEVVQTRERLLGALQTMKFDLIISDFLLEGFDGKSAIGIVLQKCPETPFIFLSGAKGQEVAIEAFERGATDFVLKEKIERLIPAVRRALHKAETERMRKLTEAELKESSEKYRSLFEHNIVASFISTPAGEVVECNSAYLRLLGFSSEEEAKAAKTEFLAGNHLKKPELIEMVRLEREIELANIRIPTKRGETVQVDATIIGKFDEQNVLREMLCYVVDSTKQHSS